MVALTAPRKTVRISDVVEVGEVQCIDKHNERGLHCCSWSLPSPEKGKERRVSVSSFMPKKQFSVASPSASRPSFEAALMKSFEKSGTGRTGSDPRIAALFQGDGINICNCINVDRL